MTRGCARPSTIETDRVRARTRAAARRLLPAWRPVPACRPGRRSASTSGISPSWPTSTTARPRSSTRCSARPARSGPTRRRRSRPRLGRPRAREGHHDPRQADDGRLRRHPPEHRRHAGPRRLRRRGRAQPADGRRGPAPRGRRGGAAARRPATCSRRRWRAACRSSSRINKIDRGDARPAEVLDAVYELFIDLGADDDQIDFPVVYTNAKAGHGDADLAEPGTDLRPLLDLLVERHAAAPPTSPATRSSCWSPTSRANDYVGRMAVGSDPERDDPRWASASASCARRRTTRPDRVEPGRIVTLDGHGHGLTTAQGHRARRHRGGRPGRHRVASRACPT